MGGSRSISISGPVGSYINTCSQTFLVAYSEMKVQQPGSPQLWREAATAEGSVQGLRV